MEEKRTSKVLLVLALIATVFYLFPFLLMLLNSLKTTGEFTSNPFAMPAAIQWGNYPYAIEQMHFLTSLKNSLVLTVSVCALITFFGPMAAYVVSRVKHPFVTTLYYMMIASMCAPFQAFMIPLVKLYASTLGFNNSPIPVIYVGLGLNICFSIFLVRGFLNSIPRDLDEAALIDGCGSIRLYFFIILPMLTPILITLLVFVAMGIWNDYLLSALFLNTQDKRTLPMMIRVFCAQYSNDYSPMMAGLMMSILPMLAFYLTGQKKCDMSIATFSFYFDIYKKCYWQEMLHAIGISEAQLPELVEPCSVAGQLKPELSQALRLDAGTLVNVGTLDHFAGMIGTGNIDAGGVTLSTGTVMAMAVMASEPVPQNTGIAMHYGFLPDTHVMLPVVESGGVSLEWFRRSCMKNITYDEMNATLARRERNDLLFLPYLVGTSAPEFDAEAKGVFWGLRQEHDCIDMAGSIMEGVGYVLQKNLQHIHKNGIQLQNIIATGGGAKSPIWCQLYADITGLPVRIPAEKEAACLGAAMIAAVADGKYADFAEASKELVSFSKEYTPNPCEHFDRKYRRFCKLYEAALEINNI